MAMSTVAQAVDYMCDIAKHMPFWKENADKVCEDEEDIRGKIVVVTGCNTGIGKEVAFQIAKRGATLIMAVRNMEKGQQALYEIKKRLESQEINAELMTLDLGDLQSIRDFVKNLEAKHDHVDILINNAGFMDTNPVVTKTKDGFEQHIGVNHLGPFLLTQLLLPLLQKAPEARIVCVASSNLAIAPLNFMEDLMMETKHKSGDYGKEQYSISKLCNAIAMVKFANTTDLGKVKLFQLCPGLVKSEVFRNETGQFRKFRNAVSLMVAGLTTHQGAETVVFCAVAKSLGDAEGKGEMYRFTKPWAKGTQILKGYLETPQAEVADKLYSLSEQLVGMRNAQGN